MRASDELRARQRVDCARPYPVSAVSGYERHLTPAGCDAPSALIKREDAVFGAALDRWSRARTLLDQQAPGAPEAPLFMMAEGLHLYRLEFPRRSFGVYLAPGRRRGQPGMGSSGSHNAESSSSMASKGGSRTFSSALATVVNTARPSSSDSTSTVRASGSTSQTHGTR